MNDEKTSREKRRRRRLKNQICAYLMLGVIIVLLLAAGYFGIKSIIHYMNDYSDKVSKVIEEAESSIEAEQDSEIYSEEVPVITGEHNEGYASPAEDDPLDTLVNSLLNELTIEEMVAGMFVVSPEAITGVGTAVQAGEGTKTAITENPVGGLVYEPKNFQTPEQFTEMLTNTRNYAKYPVFTIVSAECGSTDYGLEVTAKASELAAADNVWQAYEKIASGLAAYGIDMNLAPVAEIVSTDDGTSLQEHAFGSDALTVASEVTAAVQAMQQAGVSAVLQKFPGTTAGSKTLDELRNSEFMVYETAIKNGVDCIMVSHVKANGVTGDDTLSSLSTVMISDVLRNTLGFNGVVMTDYLDDSAVTGSYSSAEAAVAAVQAGADLLLSPEDYQEAYEGVLQAVIDGIITQERIRESVYRIYCVKYKYTVE